MKTGTEIAIEVLKEMRAMPIEELLAEIEERKKYPHHPITQMMIDIGYFDRLEQDCEH